MLTVKLPDGLETRLENVSKAFGRSKQEIVLAAINEQLQDMEDALTAQERLDDPEGEWVSLEEIMANFGLNDKPEPQP